MSTQILFALLFWLFSVGETIVGYIELALENIYGRD
jgi:hypothetical protein